jgi:hypothetical protein
VAKRRAERLPIEARLSIPRLLVAGRCPLEISGKEVDEPLGRPQRAEICDEDRRRAAVDREFSRATMPRLGKASRRGLLVVGRRAGAALAAE